MILYTSVLAPVLKENSLAFRSCPCNKKDESRRIRHASTIKLTARCIRKPRVRCCRTSSSWQVRVLNENNTVTILCHWIIFKHKLCQSYGLAHSYMHAWQTTPTLLWYKVVQIWPGLICTNVNKNQSRSYLNHLVHMEVDEFSEALFNFPKHVKLTRIINNPLLLHLVGCLYYLYQWCTVKQI